MYKKFESNSGTSLADMYKGFKALGEGFKLVYSSK